MAEVFVARQPIFDRQQRVFAYELLFRAIDEDTCSCPDGDYASQRMIGQSLNTFGFDQLTAGRPAFLNLTRSLLVERAATLLPPTAW